MSPRPIPKQLLIHQALYYKKKEDGGTFGGGSDFDEPITLLNVRIDRSTKTIVSANGQEKQLNATLFFDMVNSKPRNVSFTTGSKVHFDGEDLFIERVDPLYARSKTPHHYELRLV